MKQESLTVTENVRPERATDALALHRKVESARGAAVEYSLSIHLDRLLPTSHDQCEYDDGRNHPGRCAQSWPHTSVLTERCSALMTVPPSVGGLHA
jgi:hypothetical protein